MAQPWLTDIASRKVRPKTLTVYEGYVRRYLVPLVGKHRLTTLRPQHIRAMHTEMVEGMGLSSTTALQAHAILSRALKIALGDGMLASNPCAVVDRPTAADNPHGAMGQDDYHAVLALLAAMANSRSPADSRLPCSPA